ncbi:hypothetical protein [Hydrogenispora ethanolica]|uniref:hypothetical protein n=1 Tax=Hydrogenispora ethanolica TaxID=1082276 RepID=UPI001045C6FE|nr:hypothetical protein [Hydrogenispora ethanolica]
MPTYRYFATKTKRNGRKTVHECFAGLVGTDTTMDDPEIVKFIVKVVIKRHPGAYLRKFVEIKEQQDGKPPT